MGPRTSSLALALGLAAWAGAAVSATCDLVEAHRQWSGSCGALIEDTPSSATLGPAAAIASGTWRRDENPVAVWSGSVKTAEYPPTPVEVEVYADHGGVMRTLFGWFPVSYLARSGQRLRFDVDPEHEVTPSGVDRDIVVRARAILASVAAWNRADNRKCAAGAKTFSIYCAMETATIEVAGAFHHRRPALQVVRAIVDERSAGRPYDHRLMDYNNDPTTTLADVQGLFAEAQRRIDAHHVGSGAPEPGAD